jgi:hypothetical protein
VLGVGDFGLIQDDMAMAADQAIRNGLLKRQFGRSAACHALFLFGQPSRRSSH